MTAKKESVPTDSAEQPPLTSKEIATLREIIKGRELVANYFFASLKK